MTSPSPSIGVLIRFANSASTLPRVLAALKQQTLQPHRILGVASQSTDGSRAMLIGAGAKVIEWTERYEHSRVLNFGLKHLDTDLVLVLSSHTVLESPQTLAFMVATMADERTACVSLKWDADPHYSNRIDWQELRTKGLKFGSIYSNSMGMIRRSLWQDVPFDESLPTAEDYAWVIEQVKRGHVCQRLALPFSYQRGGTSRDGEFARITFGLARRHGLKVTWLGVRHSLQAWITSLMHRPADARQHQARLGAWLLTRAG